MEHIKKILQMTFATEEGGTLRLSVGNPLDTLTPEEVKDAMDTIVTSNVLETKKGDVIGKATARYVTQEIEEISLA